MNTNLEKLEYNRIQQELSKNAITYIGKEKSLQLIPINNKEKVKNLLNETDEAVQIIYKNGIPPIDEIEDNTINLKILESYGTLSIQSILQLTKILIICNNLKKFFYVEHVNTSKYPYLESEFSKLYTNTSIIEKIKKSITEENTIDDNASSTLINIRKTQKRIEQNIKSRLNDFIHSSSHAKYIQENVITIRNDRYVIPVKEEYRTQIKGFVHDISSSGSTIFIEPISIFEMNNELANLKIEETQEIEKILQELTNLFCPYISELRTNINTIGILDFIFAKAKYSKSINGITPKLNDDKIIILNNAKHPLLNPKEAIPFSLTLGKDFSSLVITGPNTGGKTVTLKTIGLLTCMACSGLNIPANENSSIYVFDNVFADIGDDQSISDSLSTFSSHIKNIVDIANNATENSLILVDELGSGTDPIEGAALATSILNYFYTKGALTVATTHYQELKKFALVTDGFENASVEFDINTLSPTYHLLIGVPGKSNAFEISKKLGLSEKIINTAKSNLSKKDIDFEELLKNIYDNKSRIEKEKANISNELEKVTNLRKSLERDNSNLLEQEKDIINNAKIKARDILLNAKQEANEIISKMNKTASNSELNNLRNNLNNDIKKMSTNKEPTIKINSLEPKDIKINMSVFVTTVGKEGIIVSNISKSNDVQVQIGNMKITVNIKYLQKVNNNTKKSTSSVSYNSVSKTRNAKSEINVIGLTVDDAIFVVDKFLDDCSLAKLETARIVHGKGTGKLREGIHKFLKSNPHVKSFRLGTYGEGEMGVTVIELK